MIITHNIETGRREVRESRESEVLGSFETLEEAKKFYMGSVYSKPAVPKAAPFPHEERVLAAVKAVVEAQPTKARREAAEAVANAVVNALIPF